ncbi:hypothetical protein K504DRAFT_492885 [Pleomassaria siparia CBS 279.74]|uniref:Uncharacterized protein n=1 Tax=Pleomassaria siparia CBS 279.74 TaxID=1314801 RepID=A0A6G1K3G7_9PLEO|nr:hypothetical protein K504DRAFT_492885 [Pleomassaria siparia CBS 279.74]
MVLSLSTLAHPAWARLSTCSYKGYARRLAWSPRLHPGNKRLAPHATQEPKHSAKAGVAHRSRRARALSPLD